MNKHSPGPWKWEAASHLYGGDEPGERQVLASPEHWVLSTHPDDDTIIVTPEDAALIAAAPEMLELLRAFVRETPTRTDEVVRAEALLARFK